MNPVASPSSQVQPNAKVLQGPPSLLPHTSISGVPLMAPPHPSPPTESLVSLRLPPLRVFHQPG